MIPRALKSDLIRLLENFPAVALLGPRQVGKTTLAFQLRETIPQSIYLDLELPSDLVKLTDPEDYFARHSGQLLILDEIHRKPDLFAVLRSIIDSRKRAGLTSSQFLLLGSASLELLKQSSESLAGRLATLELTPLLLSEVDSVPGAIDRLWLRGGFPDSFLAPTEEASFEWRLAFIRTYLERDIPALGPRIPAETLRRFWTILSHNQGTLLNQVNLAASLGVSNQTIGRYIDLLVDILLVRRLLPWSGQTQKRHVRSPKTYVRDSGLVHCLLGIKTIDDLLGHPVCGGSWEGFVIENVLSCIGPGTRASFYRTAAGAEIDLVLGLGGKGTWAIEIKRSSNPQVSRGFHTGCEDIGATRKIVVYPGTEVFSLGQNIEALPLKKLMDEIRT